MRSIQAFNWLEIVKLYIGAPMTTVSAPRNSSSTASLAALFSASADASPLGAIAETG